METSDCDIYNKSTIKCRYFNVGYCRLKDECPYNHPEIECDEHCTDKTCNNRHKKECINGSNCFLMTIINVNNDIMAIVKNQRRRLILKMKIKILR